MKSKYIFLFLCMVAGVAMAGVHSYTNQSVLSTGTFVKVSVKETGVHSISYETLKEWGLQPEKVAVLGYGGAMLSEDFRQHHWDDVPVVPIYMHTGADGVFNSGDYILFYAQGATAWQWSAQKQWYHTQNTYSDYGYYFVTDRENLQRVIQLDEVKYDQSSQIDVDWYMDLRVHEKDSMNLIDLKGQSGGGRELYGELLNKQNPKKSFTFDMNHVMTDLPARCVVDMAAYSDETTPVQISYAEMHETIRMTKISQTDFHTKATTAKKELSTQPTDMGKQMVTLQFKGTKAGAVAYLNYIELQVPCSLVMDQREMHIVNTQYVGSSRTIRYNMQTEDGDVQIWRVTNGVDIEQMPTSYSNGILTWVGPNGTAERYVAVNVKAQGWKRPTKVGVIDNQNLHALMNQNPYK